ncbi:uncharacterized protein I206_101903 [Kwoniella pini CBS 10737]|uniref:KH domain-containing protein n=1 Tax=Kwoniella pini CBS 10737 TaxID=1296096 RepID=A0A1B9HVE0_9TREE|nr:KH domain-containing protein [Kwoniella pini CBS 10737]OCF47229.1 KH domain-containing protein [Kwoniella pini CBS 10737]
MSEDRKSRWDDPSSSTPPNAAADASDAAARAAAIAAKIAASLRPGAQGNELVKQEKKDEGDFVKDIEVNDLRNRYVLTKGSTQKQIEEETGASVVTKGVWVPDRTKMPVGESPLYLHIVATSQSILDAAVSKVQELIDQELGPLLDQRTIVARNRALGLPPPENAPTGGRQKWPEEKLYISLESLRNFNVRAKTVGPGGMFVKYIQAETGARVQIKGQGSGFMENDTGRESDDPMHINIAAPTQDQIDRAKVLCNDLLEVLRQEWSKARDAMAAQQQQHHGQGGVYQQGYGSYAAPQGQQGGQDAYAAYYAQQNGQNGTPTSAPSATPAAGGAAGGATPAEGTDAWAQYAAYWAAYGYDVNDPQFQAWQASQYGQQGQAPQAGAATPAP